MNRGLGSIWEAGRYIVEVRRSLDNASHSLQAIRRLEWTDAAALDPASHPQDRYPHRRRRSFEAEAKAIRAPMAA